MYEVRENPQTKTIEVMVDGPLSAVEYHEMAEKSLAFIEKHGKVRVLKEIRSFNGIEFSVFKDKLILALLKHINDVTGTAVVSDEPWIERVTNFFKPTYPYPVRLFKLNQLEEARQWLNSLE